jgi:AcrR family transcriptional regulator
VAAGRAKRGQLTRDRLLAEAVALADAEGISALTMRRLAAAVGVEAMSLYHHLPGKDGLLDGLVEHVVNEATEAIGALDGSDPPTDWRETLRRRFLAARQVMRRHPWAPGLIGTRTTIPASVYAHYEALLATLVGAGFSYHLAHRALHSLGSMPLGFVQELFSPAATGGSTDVELSEAELAQMAEALPHLTAMVAAEVHDNDGDMLGWCDSQTEFEFTLDLLLDGLARQLEVSSAARLQD